MDSASRLSADRSARALRGERIGGILAGMIITLLRRPSAWGPIAMSLAAAGLVWWHVARVGLAPVDVTQPTDEGAEARLFQLLLLLQAPVVLYFAARWLPERPRAAAIVLALQVCAGLFALGSLYWLEHVGGSG
jgi:hypothetical protein